MDSVKVKTLACIKHAVACIAFLMLLGFVFTRITYISRPLGVARNVAGLSREDVDMVYVGSSSAWVYWQPLKAWHDTGLTSYLYAHDSTPINSIQYFIQEARKSQDVKLFVVDVRSLRNFGTKGDNRFHWSLDGMDVFSINRWQLINKYFSLLDTSGIDDRLVFYWDIIKYHTLTGNFASPDSWELIDNSAKVQNKGFGWIDSYHYLDFPVDYETDDRAELYSTHQAVLVDLLEYCRHENLNVLFVVSPCAATKDEMKMYNAIGDLIETYGFTYLNTNSGFYYDEMGLDFSTDFYNIAHVNPLGADKYTSFLEKYIADHYDLPNHTGDPAYSSWDEDYQRFAEEKVTHDGTILDLINWVRDGMYIAEQMSSADNIFEWNVWAMDYRFTILFAQSGEIDTLEPAEQKVLEQWNLSLKSDGDIRILSGKDVIFSNANSRETSYNDSIITNSWVNVDFMISNENSEISIVVNGVEYSPNREGINIVVINNDYRTVVDVLTVTCEDGHLVLRR